MAPGLWRQDSGTQSPGHSRLRSEQHKCNKSVSGHRRKSAAIPALGSSTKPRGQTRNLHCSKGRGGRLTPGPCGTGQQPGRKSAHKGQDPHGSTLLIDRAQILVPKTILKKPGSLEKWLTPGLGQGAPGWAWVGVSSSTKRTLRLVRMT